MKKYQLFYFNNNCNELIGEYNSYDEAYDVVKKLMAENPEKYEGHISMPYNEK